MPGVLLADPVLLRTALVNLIGNAVKFSSDADEPCIEVNTTVDGHDVVGLREGQRLRLSGRAGAAPVRTLRRAPGHASKATAWA